MKNQLFIALAAALLLTTACKDDTEELSGTHIFWFDEATSDSLNANGFNTMEISVPFVQLRSHDVFIRQASLSEWHEEQPSFQGAALVLRHAINGSDAINLEYVAVPSTLGANTDFKVFDRLKNSSGTITLQRDGTTYTKLEWE